MRSARIELILDTLRAIRGAKDLSKATDGVASSLADTAREGDKAGRAVDQAGDDMSQAARAAGKLDREIEQLTGSLREMAIAQALTGENFSKQIREQETQVRRLTRNRKLFGDFGEDAGAEAAAGFAGRFSARLGPLITSGPGLAIAGTGIGLALAPTAATALAAGVIGAAGAGGVVGGLILASKDTRVQAASKDLSETVLADLERRAGQFVTPALAGIGKVRTAWFSMGGDLDRVFASSRFVDPLVDGGIAGAQRVVAGIADMISKADPVMAQLGDSVARIGATIGSTFTLLSGDAKEGASALDDLTMAVQNFITVTGDIIHAGAAVKGYLDRVDQVIDKSRIWVEDNSAIARTLSDVGISLDLTADGFKKGSVEADAYRRVVTGAGTAVDEARLKAYALAKAQGFSAETASAAGQAAATEAAAHKDTADAMQIEKDKSAELEKQQQALKLGQDEVTAAQGALKNSLDSLGGATSLQGQQAAALKTAMDNLYGATIRNVDANETYQASWDSLSAAVRGNGRTLNVHTAAGRANRDALEALLTSNNELYTANIAAGVSVAQATKKHEARTEAVKAESRRLGLNKAETQRLIDTYGRIPPKKTTDLVLRSVDRVADALLDLALIQLHLAKGTPLPGDLRRRLARAQYGMPDTKRAHGGVLPGHAPHDRADNMVYAGTPGEWVIQRPTVRRVERERGPGAMAYFNRYGELPAPGYADGGLLKASRTHWPPNMTYRVTADMTKVPSLDWAMSKVPFMMGGNWPSSPGAQRGDSGVWRSIVALIKSTGPLSGHFGNAYRPGDPLWHGCVPMDTRILTRRGWITYDEVVVGVDETIGYNPATGKNEWTLIVGMHHYSDAELWTLQNRWFRAEVTPGHKWLVDQQVTVQTETVCTECGREFATGRGMTKHRADVHHVLTPRRERYQEQLVATRDFKQSTRIHLAKPADLGGQLPITDDEAELIGWIFGDGYMERYGPTIVQSKPEQVQYLRGFMSQFPCGEYVRQPESRQTHVIFRWKLSFEFWSDLASRSKASKDDALNFVLSMSVSQREAFVRGFLSADGTRDPRTQNERLGYAAFQVSGPVAEAIKVAAYLEGYRPDTRVNTEFDEDRFGTQPMEHIGFRTPIVKGRNLPVVAKRTADVWCPTTTLGTWTARQGEEIFLTGNSGRAVDWMGFNQDALASFLAARRPLELIHRTRHRDYAYTRGVNKGSFNNSLMEAHRNHVHIAMANGGILREPVFGYGMRSGATYSLAERGPERVSPLGAGGTVTINAPITIQGSNLSPQQIATAVSRELGRRADIYSRTG